MLALKFILKLKNYIVNCFYTIYNKLNFKLHKVHYGNHLKIFGKIKLYNSFNKIIIGNNCILRSNLNSNPLGGTNHIILFLGPSATIKIGNNVGISNSCFHIDSSLIIEDNVLIGGDCKIYDSDMHSIQYEDRKQIPDLKKKVKPILLKEGCWIGAHSIILKGVTIGKRSIIGAGSVVTKNVPDNEIWAGNPAVFIRKVNNNEE